MEGAGTLEAIAELAVGVLGFSGIVAALGQRASGEWTALDRRRFFAMVFVGAAVILLSLLPFPLYHAGLRAGSLWGWASAGGGALALFFPFALLHVSPSMSTGAMWRDRGVSNLALVLSQLGVFGAPLLLWINASGILFERTFAPYLVSVLVLFCVALMLFVRLLQTAVRIGDRAA
jgi:hypothetical protein